MKWLGEVPPQKPDRDTEKKAVEKRLSEVERRLRLIEAEVAVLRRKE